MRGFLLSSFTLFCLVSVKSVFAQNATSDPFQNRVIQRHFGQEITKIQLDCPAKMQEIMFYFTASFDVTSIACPSCQVNTDSLFNYYLFDITNFEHLREESNVVEVLYKDLFQIILHDGQSVANQVQTIYSDNPFELPAYTNTGNLSDDYAAYKAVLELWRKDHPYRFKVAMNNQDIRIMKEIEFLNLSPQKVDALTSVANGYLIVD